MPELYKSRHGIDWPDGMQDVFIDLTVAKKHRQLAARGMPVKDPWEALLSACRELLSPAQFRISSWSEEHAHDFVMYKDVITWGSAASSKSNDYGLFALLDWVVDPFDTLWLVGSTTMKDLRVRTWESVARYFTTLKNNHERFAFPGKLDERGLSILNVADQSTPESVGAKAGIRGVALNEEGRLQGSHLPYVRVLVDELATVRDHESLGVDVANLLVGTRDFRFFGLANPEGWDHVSSQYCRPPPGITVDVDTGSWTSSMGYFVRHHDGLKSPCILKPHLVSLFPHLMNRDHYDDNLRRADGNEDAPRIWKMVRGFPQPGAQTVPTILDARVATASRCGEALEAGTWRPVGVVMGIDPAWSDGGDDAVAAVPRVVEIYGKPTLDFTGRVYKLPILASSQLPVTRQLREQVWQLLNAPGGPSLTHTAVDSSGNQGLADDLDMFVGVGCLHVNNAVRASELPLRAAGEPQRARDVVYDRGTEAWTILAEFCRAGQVRGLPTQAREALVARRYALRGRDKVVIHPLRMESKELFYPRFKGSPNEADACALAALAAKERLGLQPFGGLPAPAPLPHEMPRAQVVGLSDPRDGGYAPDFADTYQESWI